MEKENKYEKFKRVFVIVMDSLGVGEMEDSANYNDLGVNTFKHASYSKKDFSIPVLNSLGIGNITDINNTEIITEPLASYGKCHESSVGKDTLTGHFEIMGLHVTKSFPTFTDNGFPKELIDTLERETGHKFIGNYSASGTEILKVLGEEHLKTKSIIIYTSLDSVLQLAANEDVIPLDELYRVCDIARKITLDKPEWMVGRIIARPFVGKNALEFKRTPNRHDCAIKPFDRTVLNCLKDNDYDVIALGKINDIFCGEGVTETYKQKSNYEGMERCIKISEELDFTGLCFLNLVDFDSLYGHRRDAIGYANCIEEFDEQLGRLLNNLKNDDLLIITADHGNDPLHKGTDHTREYIPLLVYNKNLKGINLKVRNSFADIGATIAENFKIEGTGFGESFFKELVNK